MELSFLPSKFMHPTELGEAKKPRHATGAAHSEQLRLIESGVFRRTRLRALHCKPPSRTQSEQDRQQVKQQDVENGRPPQNRPPVHRDGEAVHLVSQSHQRAVVQRRVRATHHARQGLEAAAATCAPQRSAQKLCGDDAAAGFSKTAPTGCPQMTALDPKFVANRLQKPRSHDLETPDHSGRSQQPPTTCCARAQRRV
jgi:hypothetical protein